MLKHNLRTSTLRRSPVVWTLAKEQFDDYVKRVRIFAYPRLVGNLRRLPNRPQSADRAIAQTE